MNEIPHNINPKAKVAAPAAEKDKPRRPLSAYNLFFRFKRQKILDACKEGDIDRETVEGIVKATPGLESVSHDAVMVLPEDELEKFRSDNIRAELGDKLTPKEAGEIKARSHRKTHFKHGLSFLEMTKIISSSWKGVDDLSKKIFEDLAEDGRNIRQQLLADYTKAQEERADSPDGGKNQGQGKGKVGGKKLASVRPNAIHKPHTGKVESVASQQGQGGGGAAEGSKKECRGGNMNSNQQAIDHMRRMYGERPPQFASVAAAASAAAFASMQQQQMQQQKANSAAAGSAAAFASMHHQQQQANAAAAGSAAAFASMQQQQMQQQQQKANSAAARLRKPIESTFSTQQPPFNPLSNNPYLPKSFLSAHASGRPGNPFNTTSTADKLKMIQLEAANESMKKMLEKLVAANAELEGQNTHLTQLVGQLTAENSTLKRNVETVTPSFSYHTLTQGHGFPTTRHPQGHGFQNSQRHGRHSVTSMESAPNQERLPQQKKRPRVLADPWSQR